MAEPGYRGRRQPDEWRARPNFRGLALNVLSYQWIERFQHEFELSVADREHRIPANRPEDHLAGVPPAFEHLTLRRRRQPVKPVTDYTVFLASSETLQQSLVKPLPCLGLISLSLQA